MSGAHAWLRGKGATEQPAQPAPAVAAPPKRSDVRRYLRSLQGLSPRAKLILTNLVDRCDDADRAEWAAWTCAPSVPQIAYEAVSSVDMAKRALAELAAAKLITVIGKHRTRHPLAKPTLLRLVAAAEIIRRGTEDEARRKAGEAGDVGAA